MRLSQLRRRPSPSRSAAPGARFCRNTSAFATSLARISPRRRMLHVERQAFLGAVGPDEMRGQALHRAVVAARGVADAGALDLDHARAELGELARGERPGDDLLERDYGDAFERPHVEAHREAGERQAGQPRAPGFARAHRMRVGERAGADDLARGQRRARPAGARAPRPGAPSASSGLSSTLAPTPRSIAAAFLQQLDFEARAARSASCGSSRSGTRRADQQAAVQAVGGGAVGELELPVRDSGTARSRWSAPPSRSPRAAPAVPGPRGARLQPEADLGLDARLEQARRAESRRGRRWREVSVRS